jgi:hypothetical protein
MEVAGHINLRLLVYKIITPVSCKLDRALVGRQCRSGHGDKMGILSLLGQETLSPSRKQLQDPGGRHLILHFLGASRSRCYHDYINIITIDIRTSIIYIQFVSA